jgi:F-type H+-transporting ATPase subunit b
MSSIRNITALPALACAMLVAQAARAQDVVVVEDPVAVVPVEPAGACVDAGGGALGMPQLCADWFPNQIFWLLLALASIYLILSRVALPRIGAVLAERQGTITNDLAAADDLKTEAEQAEAAYEQALRDARAEASGIADTARADIQADLDAAIAEADERIAEKAAEGEAQIAAIREEAVSATREVARETAMAIVRAMGVEADQAAVDAAVDERMSA